MESTCQLTRCVLKKLSARTFARVEVSHFRIHQVDDAHTGTFVKE